MLGHWATDCGQSASGTNPHLTIVASSGRVTQTYNYGPSTRLNTYVTRRAEIRGDKITERLVFLVDNSTIDVVVVRKNRQIRTWESKELTGKALVVGGFITGAKRPTKWLTRCR